MTPSTSISPSPRCESRDSPVIRFQRKYSDVGPFKPTNQHPQALLDSSNKTSLAVQKQLKKGSLDLEAALIALAAKRQQEGRACMLVSPIARKATELKIGSTTAADGVMLSASAAVSSAATKV